MIIFELFYLALPAYVANMMPVIAARLKVAPFLARAIDGGQTWRGERLLGDNKTWRGAVAGILGAVIVTVFQYFEALPLSIHTDAYGTLAFAILYGVGVGVLVIVGDAVGSIIKRQLGVKSGDPSVPLDQVDYMVVFILGTLPFTAWTMVAAITLLVMTFFLNLGANFAAYVTGIKNTYW